MGWIENKIQQALEWANKKAEKIGLVHDPYSGKETYVDIYHTNGSENLNTPQMNANLDNPAYARSYPSTAITKEGKFTTGTDAGNTTPNEINTAKIDNFIPNTANGGNNMSETEKSWWDKYGSDTVKTIGTVATIGANLYNQSQQNEFNAEEAQKQRDFEANMSNTAFQRQAKDMATAGVNPVASADMGGASTPSGSQATGTTPYYADPLTIANTALTQAQVNNMQADTELKGKQSGKTDEEIKGMRIENQYKDELKRLEILTQQIENQKIKAETQKVFQEVHNMEQELRKMDEEIEILKSEGKIKEAEAKTRTRNRRAYAILEMAESATRSVGNIVGNAKGTAMLPNQSNVSMTN